VNKKAASEKLRLILARYVPEKALPYCVQLWNDTPFHFKVSRARGSKLGDYRYDHRVKSHTITVNNNLNQYAFLLTYIHEIAHLHVQLKYGRKALPHGKEWKSTFRQIMLPVLNEEIYPHEILEALKKHMKNPKASSHSDHHLYKALKHYDTGKLSDAVLLEDLKEGESFVFKGVAYQKLMTRRTRVLCLHAGSRRKYLIPKMAEVTRMDQA
jgi:SprT protein